MPELWQQTGAQAGERIRKLKATSGRLLLRTILSRFKLELALLGGDPEVEAVMRDASMKWPGCSKPIRCLRAVCIDRRDDWPSRPSSILPSMRKLLRHNDAALMTNAVAASAWRSRATLRAHGYDITLGDSP